MIHNTFNNHACCTYNGEHRHRKSNDDIFEYTIGKVTRDYKSFREECIDSAKLIKDLMSEPITILYSGGFDSEIAMESFRLAKIPVKAAFCKFDNDYNYHDYKFAKDYCDAYSIKLDEISLDLIKFWENDAFDYAKFMGCITPQLTHGPWLMDQIDGCLVASTMDIEFRRVENSNVWLDTSEESNDTCWTRFAELRGREIAPAFSQFTPEQIAAALPLFKDFAYDKIRSSNNTMCNKPEIYSSQFNLVPRPKFTGFELVEDICDIFRKEFEKELKEYYNGIVQWTYEDYEEKLNVNQRIS